jgi:hypothetical protein
MAQLPQSKGRSYFPLTESDKRNKPEKVKKPKMGEVGYIDYVLGT